jgi:hypothetical protein
MLLKDKVDPSWNKSSTASELPMREMPSTEKVEPIRLKLLRDKELAM